MRRILIYMLIGGIGLIILAAIVVQGVLWSDLPRRVIVAQLERQLGLVVQVDDVSTGWFGRTRLEAMQFSLPLENQAIFEARTITVSHAALLRLVVTGDLALQRLEVEQPRIFLRQADSGNWNVADLVQILQARFDQAEDSAGGGPPSLPDLRLIDAVIEVHRPERPAVTIGPVQVQGDAASSLRYRVAVRSPAFGEVSGHLAGGDPWQHEMELDLTPAQSVLASLGVGSPALSVRGRYEGHLANGTVQGLLTLRELHAGERSMQGQFDVRFDPQVRRLSLRPSEVTLHLAGPEPVYLRGGEARYTFGGQLELDDLALHAVGIDAVMTGLLNPQRQTGDATLTWRNGRQGDALDHRGRAELSLSRGISGGHGLRLSAEARGRTAAGEVDLAGSVRMFGPNWTTLAGRLVVDRLGLQRDGQRFDVDQAWGRLALTDGMLRLQHLHLPATQQRRLVINGDYALDSRQWQVAARGSELMFPGLEAPVGQLSLQVDGNDDRVDIRSATLTGAGLQFRATGAYIYRDPQPLSLNVAVEHLPPSRRGDQPAMVTAERLFGGVTLHGTVSPLDVRLQGELTARSLRVRQDDLGDVVMTVNGSAGLAGMELVAEAPAWFGGRWRVDGAWDRIQRQVAVEVHAQEVDLSLMPQIFDLPVALKGAGGGTMTLTVPGLQWPQFSIDGRFEADDLAVAVSGVETAAQRLEGQLQMDRRALRLTQVQLADANSRIDATMTARFDRETAIEAQAMLTHWPFAIPAADTTIDLTGETAIDFDPTRNRRVGHARVDAVVQQLGRMLVETAVDAAVSHDRLTLRRLDGRLLRGSLQGQGVVDLSDLVRSDLTIQWDHIEPAELSPWLPAMELFDGSVSGSLTARHTNEPKALEPLEITIDLDASETSFSGLALGVGDATAYSDGRRLVLQGFELAAAGGTLNLWGRLSHHVDQWHLYANAKTQSLDLQLLTQALVPQREVVGRLDTDMVVLMPLDDWRSAMGRGRISVRDSDLANIPLFQSLFSLMNLQLGTTEPDGRGEGDLRVEQGQLLVRGFRYQNRGTQINLVPLRIDDIWAGGDSRIAGSATLTQNVLPEIEFFGSVNEALAVLQSDLVAARLEGTLGQPIVTVQTLQGVTQPLTDVITGGRRAEPTDE